MRNRLISLLADKRFFYGVIVLLIIQAAWIALSGRYPMAFDEDFHFGIIKLYAHHVNPFWNDLPAGTDALGAVTRDPSYLFHYLMSFPFRLIEAFTNNQTAQVLILRGVNIGLFAWGLVLYRRLLAKSQASPALINLCLLIFVLIPIAPFLAAQINYDNLFLPLTALAFLLTLKLKADRNGRTLLLWLLVCLATSLVKYAFLPIFVALAAYLIVPLLRNGDLKSFNKALSKSWKAANKKVLAVLIIGVLIVLGLFVERYGVNVARYHKPVADCGEVLSYEHCQYYGPWIRDYNFSLSKPATHEDPLSYTQHWLYGMWFRTFFAVDGPATGFQTRSPLILPGIGVIVIAVLAGAAYLFKIRRIWQNYNSSFLWLITLVTVLYVFVLWLEEYRLFRHTGRPVAINGRYLLPVMPFLILASGLAANEALRNFRRLKLMAAGMVVLCFVWGGGALTYILRSNEAWYWVNSPLKGANHKIQNMLGPITPGYDSPTRFLH